MKVFAPICSVVLASAVLLSAMTLAPDVCAGSLRVRDDAHLLSAGDVASLQAVVASAPFDGRLLVTDAYPDVQDLSRYVGSLVAEADIVVVGLDPQHHHVAVHFGSGSRVPRAERPGIERAGNDAFRRGDWATGVAAIFQSASRAAAEAPAPGAQPPEALGDRRPQPSLFSPGLVLLVVVGILGAAIYFARRRSALGNQGYGAPPYGGPGYGGPGYPPGAGGLGPLGGGMIGAGLGGLAGYELGKLEGERQEREHDGGPRDDRGPGTDTDTGFDDGGGGSSWDDGGGDGGGFDGGGGGSDFGS
jgi:uncharacterized membrane protein YgcG